MGYPTDSIVSGPLSTTSVFLAKVATSPQNDTPNYSHLICVYMPDAYDQSSVTEVREPDCHFHPHLSHRASCTYRS